MNAYAERLLFAIKRKGMNQTELARRIGVKQQSINYLCNLKGSQTGSKHTPEIARVLGVKADWLASGKGQMELGLLDPAGLHDNPVMQLDRTDYSTKVIRIPYWTSTHGEVEMLRYQTDWLDMLDIDVDQYECLRVIVCSGKEMEQEYKEGDVVLVDIAQNEVSRVVSGEAYAINYSGEAKIRRLIRKIDGSIVVRSDNNGSPDDEHVHLTALDDLEIIGKVLAIVLRKVK